MQNLKICLKWYFYKLDADITRLIKKITKFGKFTTKHKQLQRVFANLINFRGIANLINFSNYILMHICSKFP